ncbi:MAG: hypothetical protein RQ751_14460 [Longimicrobiales bacterium]|nr:hypothetical protein [Longimicrobiales bacterium]
MLPRLRRRFGVLALLALTFSLAESVLASTCAPPDPAALAGGGDRSGAPAHAHCGDHHRGSDGHLAPVQADGVEAGGGEADPSPPPCPFSTLPGLQICLGVGTLPALGTLLPSPTWSLQARAATTAPDHGLLRALPFFRPPRA